MAVYALFWRDWNGEVQLIGIFANEEAAEKAKAKHIEPDWCWIDIYCLQE